jgi:hypothetical protein
MDLADRIGREIAIVNKVEHGIDRAVGRIAHRVALDVDAVFWQSPFAACCKAW